MSVPAALLPAIGWPGGSLENTGIIVGVIVGAYLAAVWLAALVWTARDIRDRSRDPVTQIVAVLMVLVFNLPGWMLYRVLRPPRTLAEEYDRRLEEEALLLDLRHSLVCPRCSATVEEDYVVCPSCAIRLKAVCHSCERGLNPDWLACPWCGEPTTHARAAEPPPEFVYETEREEPAPSVAAEGDPTPLGVPPEEERVSPFRRPQAAGHPAASGNN